MAINTSTFVYVHADRFVETRKRGGVEVPCRDVRVRKRDLAATAVGAALVGLAQAGHVRLSVGTRRGFLGLGRRSAVFAEPLAAAASTGGLEGALLASLSDDRDANAVRSVLERLLPISGDPWGDVIARIEEGMLHEGYFREEDRKKVAQFFLGKKLKPDCQRIDTLQEQLPAVRDMLDGFRQANADLYDQLMKDIRQGIRARQEVDVDMD